MEIFNRGWHRIGSDEHVLAERVYEHLDLKVESSGLASVVWELLLWKKRKQPAGRFLAAPVPLEAGRGRESGGRMEGLHHFGLNVNV